MFTFPHPPPAPHIITITPGTGLLDNFTSNKFPCWPGQALVPGAPTTKTSIVALCFHQKATLAM